MFTLFLNSFSQNYISKYDNFDDLMNEILIQNSNQEINYTEAYENLFQYYQNPINLNNSNEEQLNLLLFLNATQIKNIISQRQKTGDYVSIYELQVIDSLDIKTIKLLSNFIKIQPRSYSLTSEFKDNSKQNISLKMGLKNNTSPSTFLRYKLTSKNNLSIGFTAKQDADEKYSWKPNQQSYLFDFTSIHLSIQNKGRLKSLIIGDYKLQFGQNMLFSSGFNIDKSSETITSIYKNNIGTRSYISSIESSFIR